MQELQSFYKSWLGYDKYYEIILSNRISYQTEFNQNERLLQGLEIKYSIDFKEFATRNNDYRVDVPVWFGDLRKSKHRIIVFGLEPRDTHPKFNIERVDNIVFGTPFGIDRWNQTSSVPRKPQNRYFRVFDDISTREDTFLLFSDIVKSYKIVDKGNNNRANDENARKDFEEMANETKNNLMEEIQIVNPTHIITLGNDSTRIVRDLLPQNLNIIGVRHPANGGETKAKEQINQLLTTHLQ